MTKIDRSAVQNRVLANLREHAVKYPHVGGLSTKRVWSTYATDYPGESAVRKALAALVVKGDVENTSGGGVARWGLITDEMRAERAERAADADALKRLADDVERGLRGCGAKYERDSYFSHEAFSFTPEALAALLNTVRDAAVRPYKAAVARLGACCEAPLHANDLTEIPAAACGRCGGWTSYGGMSQYHDAVVPVLGRTGCTCRGGVAQ